ncbi:SDR family oxidoreductase [Porticoccaceae bacterium]|nr:SDR family oxidoreductase [Porticoccaceae bacterium]
MSNYSMGMSKQKTVLVLGASGMLGNAVYRYFLNTGRYTTFGTLRDIDPSSFFDERERDNLICGIDVSSLGAIKQLFMEYEPNVVINCIGVIKQSDAIKDPRSVISVNSLLPHELNEMCGLIGAKLVHISTDCVFTGAKGMYKENDFCDSRDLYGLTKHLGEVDDNKSVTIRTSIIGHEINSKLSLIDWFLSSKNTVGGYSRAIFSGLPTVALARIIHDHVIPNDQLCGLYHVSSDPITKFDLLSLVMATYDHSIDLIDDSSLVIDRSLDSRKFRLEAKWSPEQWASLVDEMHKDFKMTNARSDNV